jgi:hypothetical protein
MLSRAILAVPFVLLAGTAVAEQLAGDRLRQTIEGKTIHLSTPYGVELPLRYAPGGTVTGDVSGIRLAAMFAPRETGRWWIDGEQLCQQWPTWYDGQTACFTIRLEGDERLSWVRNDGLSGTARIGG